VLYTAEIYRKLNMAIIACTNTTSNLMTQLFLELAAHPSILNRM
jgi:cytochrome P450